jgi:hypothetical protein
MTMSSVDEKKGGKVDGKEVEEKDVEEVDEKERSWKKRDYWYTSRLLSFNGCFL